MFNWMFARGRGGMFLLRIEDTDTERNRPELTDNILEMLLWLGLDWDGEPVHQSERLGLYSAAAETLFGQGKAGFHAVIRHEDCARVPMAQRETATQAAAVPCRLKPRQK